MDYAESLAYWNRRINYERKPCAAGDLKLDRMRALLELLDEPQTAYPIVHIAGSKGKGSTAAMVASILEKAGYRTGLFTSPHLREVEERFRVSQVPIAAEELAANMSRVAAAVEKLDERYASEWGQVTFFEIATALAMLFFAERCVDVAVLEVGLGGRYDATNVCDPAVTAITSISLDHTQILGTTAEQIAREKAGIVKPGRPLISGVRDARAAQVVEEVCLRHSSPLIRLGHEIQFEYTPGHVSPNTIDLPQISVTTKRPKRLNLELGLLGEHQAANAAIAIGILDALAEYGFAVSERAIATGLKEIDWPARIEIVDRQPMTIFDCAHNDASAKALVDTLQREFSLWFEPPASNGGPDARQRNLVFGTSRDKDVRAILSRLLPHFHRVVFTRFVGNPRGLEPETLLDLALSLGHENCEVAPTPEAAWQRIAALTRPEDLLCATGSVFLCGELLPNVVRQSSVTP